VTEAPLRELVATVAAGLDRGVVAGAAMRRKLGRRTPERLGPEARIEGLERLAEAWDRPAWRDGDAFFPVPAVNPRERPLPCPFPGAEAVEITWQRDYDPVVKPIAGAYLGHRANLRFEARWFRGTGRPRPTLLAIHGYGGGSPDWEQRIFPVRRLLASGLDVVLPVLPFHGSRAAGGVRFPGADPRWTLEGFRHAITDLRALLALIRGRGAPRLGAWGMSLGGYTASLLATVEALDFLVPLIPLASLPDFALEHGRLHGTPEQVRAQHEGLQRVYRAVSPLHRTPRVPGEQVLVLAGRADRITGPTQAEHLAAHFGGRLVVFPGGHLLQIGMRGRLDEAIALSLG